MSLRVRELIAYMAVKEDKPREDLARTIQRQVKQMGEPVPGEETLKRMISSVRNHGPLELDQPWHMSTIAYHPMPLETLSVVLKAWADAFARDEEFSIRQALWVSRIYYVFKDAGHINATQLLIETATHYASHERAMELMKLTKGTKESQKDSRLHQNEDARLVEMLDLDDRPMRKIIEQTKLVPMTEADQEEAGLPELFRTALDKPHSFSRVGMKLVVKREVRRERLHS